MLLRTKQDCLRPACASRPPQGAATQARALPQLPHDTTPLAQAKGRSSMKLRAPSSHQSTGVLRDFERALLDHEASMPSRTPCTRCCRYCQSTSQGPTIYRRRLSSVYKVERYLTRLRRKRAGGDLIGNSRGDNSQTAASALYRCVGGAGCPHAHRCPPGDGGLSAAAQPPASARPGDFTCSSSTAMTCQTRHDPWYGRRQQRL